MEPTEMATGLSSSSPMSQTSTDLRYDQMKNTILIYDEFVPIQMLVFLITKKEYMHSFNDTDR